MALGLLLAVTPALVGVTLLTRARGASAHGAAVGPPARAYSCWKRWGDQWQSPAMATEDPMCDQAWKADPNAMWNWNGLYQDGVGGDHQAAVPDGQLCSGGNTSNGRYAALDTPGPWHAERMANDFNVTVHDQARHGADYYRVYVTKQGFDPLTQRLGWGDLDLVTETGKIAPGQGSAGDDDQLNGVSVQIPARAPGRTGRHIVFTLWQASHQDQSYYFCSDVIFGEGADPAPPPAPTTAVSQAEAPASTAPEPAPAPAPSDPPPTAPAPGSPGPGVGAGRCRASYRMLNQWPGGFQGEVTVTADGGPIRGWTVSGRFPDGQTIRQSWNTTMAGNGPQLAASNEHWNGSLDAGATTTFGFIGNWRDANGAPSLTCRAS